MEENMLMEILEISFLNNRILDNLICKGVFLLSMVAIKIFERIILKKLKKWAEKTITTLDDFIVSVFERVVTPFLYLGAFYVSIQILTLNAFLVKVVNVLGIAALTIFTVRAASRVINYGFAVYSQEDKPASAFGKSLTGIVKGVNILLWSRSV